MTEGERMVWAAVFARAYDSTHAPIAVRREPALRAEYERGIFARAVTQASAAIDAMRTSEEREHDTPAALRLRAMLNDGE